MSSLQVLTAKQRPDTAEELRLVGTSFVIIIIFKHCRPGRPGPTFTCEETGQVPGQRAEHIQQRGANHARIMRVLTQRTRTPSALPAQPPNPLTNQQPIGRLATGCFGRHFPGFTFFFFRNKTSKQTEYKVLAKNYKNTVNI